MINVRSENEIHKNIEMNSTKYARDIDCAVLIMNLPLHFSKTVFLQIASNAYWCAMIGVLSSDGHSLKNTITWCTNML